MQKRQTLNEPSPNLFLWFQNIHKQNSGNKPLGLQKVDLLLSNTSDSTIDCDIRKDLPWLCALKITNVQ